MKKPIIGITLDEEKSKTYSKYPWYAARKNYSESIDLAGGTSIFLPHSNVNINQYLNLIQPKFIFLGEKDYQQYYLISNFIKDKCDDCKPGSNNPNQILQKKCDYYCKDKSNKLYLIYHL